MVRISCMVAFVLAALLAGMLSAKGPTPGPMRAAIPASSQPQSVDDILRTLVGATDSKATEQALASLQGAMAQQTRQVVLLQQANLQVQEALAGQLRTLTGLPDKQAVAGLVEHQAAVYRWAQAACHLPAEQRDAVLVWGLKNENLPLVAKVFGSDTDAKADAIRQLAAQKADAATDWMLLALLNDRDREIDLLTIDALYDRQPSAAILDSLCDRLFGFVLDAAQQVQHTLHIHGRQVTIYDAPITYGYNAMDADLAVDLLIKYKDPHVAEKLDNFFWQLLVAWGGTNLNDGRLSNVLSERFLLAQAFGRLIEAYRPKNALVLCARLLESDPAAENPRDAILNVEGQETPTRQSLRVDAASMLIRATGQSPADYGIIRLPLNQLWLVKGGAREENDMLKKLHAWLTDHAKDLAIDPPGVFPESPTGPTGPRGRAGGAVLP